jgi:hypothetical protein
MTCPSGYIDAEFAYCRRLLNSADHLRSRRDKMRIAATQIDWGISMNRRAEKSSWALNTYFVSFISIACAHFASGDAISQPKISPSIREHAAQTLSCPLKRIILKRIEVRNGMTTFEVRGCGMKSNYSFRSTKTTKCTWTCISPCHVCCEWACL